MCVESGQCVESGHCWQVDGLLESVKKLADAADYELDTGTHVLHSVTPFKRASAKSASSLYAVLHQNTTSM